MKSISSSKCLKINYHGLPLNFAIIYKQIDPHTDAVQFFKGCINAGINFIQNHPPPGTNPRDTTRREQKPSPRDNNCVQKPFPRDKTGSQKPHPRDIKLENSDTISNEKLCRLNK